MHGFACSRWWHGYDVAIVSVRRDRLRLFWSFVASAIVNISVWVVWSARIPLWNDVHANPIHEKLVISSAKVRIERRIVRRPQPPPPEVPPPSFLGPPQPAALSLPHGWARQDFGNVAQTDTTIWLDWGKQSAKFVPRVFLWQKKFDVEYMHRPSLQDAVDEVLTSLHADNAEIAISKAQRVCDGQRDGWFLSYVKPDDDPPMHIDETIFMTGETVFRATYIRPVDQPEDTQTRDALNTLCA